MADADRRIFQGAVSGTDRPTLVLERADDVLGVLSLGEPQARHGPTVATFARQELHAVLGAPRLDPAPHRVVPFPARIDAAFALDPRQLYFERSEEHTSELQSRLH